MRASLLSYEGDRDAIRFGCVRFVDGRVRRFQYDRLSGVVRLYARAPVGLTAYEDDMDEERVKVARKLVLICENDRRCAGARP